MDILRHQSSEGLFLHGLGGLKLYQAMKPQIKALHYTLTYCIRQSAVSLCCSPCWLYCWGLHISEEGVTSCFLNGSDPSITARVSDARWVLTILVFPPACTIITQSSPVIKSLASSAVLTQKGRPKEVMQGQRPQILNACYKHTIQITNE